MATRRDFIQGLAKQALGPPSCDVGYCEYLLSIGVPVEGRELVFKRALYLDPSKDVFRNNTIWCEDLS